MTDEYSVGYGKPPRQHRFQQGNQAARKRKGKANPIALPRLIERALRTKRKIRRGEVVYSVHVAEILVERLIQTMTTGSARDLAMIVQLLECYLPDALASKAEALEISYHRAEGSSVTLRPTQSWQDSGS